MLSERTTQKTLISDQLAGQGERLQVVWFIIKVNELQGFLRQREQSSSLSCATKQTTDTIAQLCVGNTHRSVQYCGDKIISNALHFKCIAALVLGLIQDGSLRVHSNYLK